MSLKAMIGVAVALTAVLSSPAFAAKSARDAHAVRGTAGQYVGSDPDPFIRSQLARDPSQGGAVMER
jgi:hypothetical protein